MKMTKAKMLDKLKYIYKSRIGFLSTILK